MYASKSITVRAEPEATWEAVERLEAYPQWNPLIVELRTFGGDLQTGRKVRGALRLGAKQQAMRGEVVDYHRGARLRLKLGNLVYWASLDWRVEPERVGSKEAASKVTLSLAYESRVPLIGPLIDELTLGGVSSRPVEACLEQLKARVEGAGRTDTPSGTTVTV